MESQTKICQNCKSQFVIEPEDFEFYDKIKVPAPTFCPDCRLQRRLSFRNEFSLYKRTCDLCKKDMLSLYRPDSPYTVYCLKCFNSDNWDPLSYGQEYDFSKPFFEQVDNLMKKTPLPTFSRLEESLTNSDYSNQVSYLKNCYLLFNSDYNDNCSYGFEVESSKDSYNNLAIDGCELMGESVNCQKCQQTFYSSDCESCHNIWFSKNLSGCSDCFGCINLRNKQYHIFNQSYSKEEYQEKIGELINGSYSGLLRNRRLAKELYLKNPVKYMHGRSNADVSGDYIYHSNNVHNSYIATESQNCRYCTWLLVKPVKDCWDYTEFGNGAERIYESIVVGNKVADVKFSPYVFKSSSSVEYSSHCYTGNNIFGCISLRKKSYCILNKQYSEAEFNELREKIIKQMGEMPYTDKKGRIYKYGEFLPTEISPFAYNETTAQQFFPLKKEEAQSMGFDWTDPAEKNIKIDIYSEEIPDNIRDVNDIIGKVIECAHKGQCQDQCTMAFRVIASELEFYKKFNLPLPRLCPNCRHYEHLKERTPAKLWKRNCQCAGVTSENGIYQNQSQHSHGTEHCFENFETAYSPDKQEIIYCDKCYQSEIF